MKPIFCGNFDFDARASDLERLFRRYGKVDRVDLKSGYAFIYMDDERDADYAIRALDRSEYGRKGRRLRVEWSKHERDARKPVSSRRSANLRPSKTLFVINFPYHTKTTDLERHFDPYGKIVNVRIRKNFAFVQYETQEDATRALDATNMSKLQDRVISVEYSSRDDDERRKGGYSPDRRVRDRSLDRRRSPSPYRRERGSPDYGTGPSPVGQRRERGSPDYGTRSSRSPRRVERRSPKYGTHSSRSPPRGERRSFEYGPRSSPSPRPVGRSPDYVARSNRSPRRVERRSLEYGTHSSRSPQRGERRSFEYGPRSSPSPRPVGRSPEYGAHSSRSPRRAERRSSEYGPRSSPSPRPVGRSPDYGSRSNRSSRDGERNGNGNGNGNGYGRSASPEEGAISDDGQEPRSPINEPDMRDRSPIKTPGLRDSSPVGEYGSPIDSRYRSPSPPARERL